MRRTGIAKFLGILLASVILSSMFAVFPETAQAATTIYVPDHYPTIQTAIDAASPGDIIVVRDGTYTENVNVNKRLTIRSQNGADLTIIQAANSGDHGFDVSTSYVTLQGFTIKGTSAFYAGISLYPGGHCNVLDNIIIDNATGIFVRNSAYNFISRNTINSNYWGIELTSGSNNIIENTINYNHVGILCSGSGNSIDSNFFSGNLEYAIHTYYNSTNHTITANTMTGNGIKLEGDITQVTSHNIATTNSVNGKPVYYYKNRDEGFVPSDAGQIILANCRNIIVKDQHIDRINHMWSFGAPEPSAIDILYSSQCLIEDNWVQGSIGLYSSVNNIINCNTVEAVKISSYSNNNTITYNTTDVINVRSSNTNVIYLNDIEATNNYGPASGNFWDSPEKITYTYNGGVYANYLGNYWNDYTGIDSDGNGIGDTPHPKDSDSDYYPLMHPFENYEIVDDVTPTPPADVTDLALSETTSNSATLIWTAPGNDVNTGTASEYDIRYSADNITEANWDSATQCTDEPTPQPAGSSENFTVAGLSAGTTYYFALKTADEVPNWSGLSNVATGETIFTPSVTTLSASEIDSDSEIGSEECTIHAVLNANLDSMCGASSVIVSFEYGIDTFDHFADNMTMTGIGAFSENIMDLIHHETYRFRARAKIPGGDWVYGDTLTFVAVPIWRANIEDGDILYSHPTYEDNILEWLAQFLSWYDPLLWGIQEREFPNSNPHAAVYVGHTGMYIGNDTVIEADGFWDSVKKNPIWTWDSKHKENVFLLRVKPRDGISWAQMISKAIDFAEFQEHDRYNITAYILGTKHYSISQADWYCSELVWASYYNEGNKPYSINIEQNDGNTDQPEGYKISDRYTNPVFPSEVRNDEDIQEIDKHTVGNMVETGEWAIVLSPVDIVVRTPDGYIIQKGFTNLPGATYNEADFNNDGELEDIIYIPTQVIGDYHVTVVPHPGASQTDTYNLFFISAGTGNGIWYAIETRVMDIPPQGYTIRWDGDTMQLVEPSNQQLPSQQAPSLPRSSPPMSSPPRILKPAQISVQYVSVSPQQTYADQPVTITTNVVNTGDEAGNYNLILKINGQMEQQKMVSVGPQGTQPVKFTMAKSQPGTYTVDIAGQKGSFTVLGSSGSTTGTPAVGGLIAILIVGILVIVVSALLILDFRRSAH